MGTFHNIPVCSSENTGYAASFMRRSFLPLSTGKYSRPSSANVLAADAWQVVMDED